MQIVAGLELLALVHRILGRRPAVTGAVQTESKTDSHGLKTDLVGDL
jgi:hypothetical protein